MYHIQLNEASQETPVWSGTFQMPDMAEDQTNILIHLSSMSGFDRDILKECGKYEVRVEAEASSGLKGEFILPFTFISSVKPPASIAVTNVTENTALLTWSHSDCSNSDQVLIVIYKDGDVVKEYQPQPQETEQLLQGLQACSDYLVEVYGLQGGDTSDLSQMMLLITRPDITGAISLQSRAEALVLNLETDFSKCLQVKCHSDEAELSTAAQEVRVTACQSEDELCEAQTQCHTATIQPNASRVTLTEKKPNTHYGVSLHFTLLDNSTETVRGNWSCLRTKVIVVP